MKKVLLLSFILMIVLVGCSNNKSETKENISFEQTPEQLLISKEGTMSLNDKEVGTIRTIKKEQFETDFLKPISGKLITDQIAEDLASKPRLIVEEVLSQGINYQFHYIYAINDDKFTIITFVEPQISRDDIPDLIKDFRP